MPKLPPSARFFYSKGISCGLLSWLVFRQSVKGEHWSDSARNTVKPECDENRALSLWMRAQPAHSILNVASGWPVCVLGASLGLLSMVGACSYSGSEPVNLWLLLTLFALLPLLFTLAACFGWKSVTGSANQSFPILSQLLFRSLLEKIPSSDLNHQTLLTPWLLWKLQWLAITFQLGALVAFYLMALFQDLAFAWSSTIVADPSGMTSLLQAIALPWQWLIPAPSTELIANSQYYRGNDFDSQLLGQWWSYIAMTIIVYGLLPRLLLVLWMRYRLARLLLTEMRISGDIDLFFNALSQSPDVETQHLGNASEITCTLSSTHRQSDAVYIAWQWKPESIQVKHTLGLGCWDDDVSCIKSNALGWRENVIFLVTLAQTPTAELADIFNLTRSCNSNLNIEISVVEGDSAVAVNKHDGTYASWQLFAQKYSVPISLLQLDQNSMEQGGRND